MPSRGSDGDRRRPAGKVVQQQDRALRGIEAVDKDGRCVTDVEHRSSCRHRSPGTRARVLTSCSNHRSNDDGSRCCARTLSPAEAAGYRYAPPDDQGGRGDRGESGVGVRRTTASASAAPPGRADRGSRRYRSRRRSEGPGCPGMVNCRENASSIHRRSRRSMVDTRRRMPRFVEPHACRRGERGEHVGALVGGQPGEIQLVVIAKERRPLGHRLQRGELAQRLDQRLRLAAGQRQPDPCVQVEREQQVGAVVRTVRGDAGEAVQFGGFQRSLRTAGLRRCGATAGPRAIGRGW